jgi:glycosyltransferase involved in cell wall biosynthesis
MAAVDRPRGERNQENDLNEKGLRRNMIAANVSTPLSVIVPTYNRSAMVQECVRLLQACGVPGLQILVVDDGSTDDTEEKVRALGDNVLYLRQRNQGPAAARNLGFQHSAGRYVAFVDSDDHWLPDVAAKIVGLLDRNPDVDAVFADAQFVWPDWLTRTRKMPASWLEFAAGEELYRLPYHEPEPGFRVFEGLPFFRRMAERNPVFISAVIMRREAFDGAGRFDPELRGAADWELWLRMASRLTFGCWPEPLAAYLRHDGCMSDDSDHMKKEFWQALKRCRAKCTGLGPAEQDLLRRQERHALFGYAYDAYNRGKYREARVRFGTQLRECGFEARVTLLWALCALPPRLTEGLRKMKRVFARD